jgi:hypothetical protein
MIKLWFFSLVFNNVWSFVLSLSDKPRWISVVQIGIVDQKKRRKWKRQCNNIDKHVSVNAFEREKKETYCNSSIVDSFYLRRMTNIILDTYYMYVFCLTVKNPYWTMTSGNRKSKRIHKVLFICIMDELFERAVICLRKKQWYYFSVHICLSWPDPYSSFFCINSWHCWNWKNSFL